MAEAYAEYDDELEREWRDDKTPDRNKVLLRRDLMVKSNFDVALVTELVCVLERV